MRRSACRAATAALGCCMRRRQIGTLVQLHVGSMAPPLQTSWRRARELSWAGARQGLTMLGRVLCAGGGPPGGAAGPGPGRSAGRCSRAEACHLDPRLSVLS